jgi:hypothetical protein
MNTMSNLGDWTPFLKQYAAVAGTGEWPGNAGATEEQLSAMEKRLKVKLPPSYRAFLSSSNGWREVSHEIPLLRPVENIRWFRKEHPDWVEAYVTPMQGIEPRPISEQDYFNYANADCVNFDVRHLAQTLCVSELSDAAVLLLNPMVVWPDGEWETWFFANWLPGAIRYRSFADWMRHELAGLLDEPFKHTQNPGELPTVYLDSPVKANRRVRPREKVLVLVEVLTKLGSKKNRERVKAAQQLARLGGKEAIAALLNALKSDSDRDVRCEAAESLGHLRVPDTVEALIAAIDDSGVNSTAIHALSSFGDERSAQRLLKLVEENGLYGCSAAYVLAKRRDARAVPILARFLTSKEPHD